MDVVGCLGFELRSSAGGSGGFVDIGLESGRPAKARGADSLDISPSKVA